MPFFLFLYPWICFLISHACWAFWKRDRGVGGKQRLYREAENFRKIPKISTLLLVIISNDQVTADCFPWYPPGSKLFMMRMNDMSNKNKCVEIVCFECLSDRRNWDGVPGRHPATHVSARGLVHCRPLKIVVALKGVSQFSILLFHPFKSVKLNWWDIISLQLCFWPFPGNNSESKADWRGLSSYFPADTDTLCIK